MLNSEQKKAVAKKEGPLLVIAGAGSGKTRVIVERILHLIASGISERSILAITFTNKAALEMKERLIQKHVHPHVMTFHKLGHTILRNHFHLCGLRENFSILDEEDALKVLKQVIQKDDEALSRGELKEIKQAISMRKNSLEESHQDPLHIAYEKVLRAQNCVDFDDLLYLPNLLFQKHPEILGEVQNQYRYIHVDEYQDTNEAQYSMITNIAKKHKNFCVVGDPDQSIYSWRGADMSKIIRFKEDYPDAFVVTLEKNYRSVNTILDAANALIQNNGSKYSKNLRSDLGEGEKIKVCPFPSQRDEASFVASEIQKLSKNVPLDQIAVFYRLNALSRSFEDALVMEGIPYVCVGSVSFYQRKEVKDVLAFLKASVRPFDPISFARTVSLIEKGVGKKSIEKLIHSFKGDDFKAYLRGEECPKLPLKQKRAIENYLCLLDKLERLCLHSSIEAAITALFFEGGYQKVLAEDTATKKEREDNIYSLMQKAGEWGEQNGETRIHEFLDEISLNESEDKKVGGQKVKLMTFHHSKGLEFEAVFMTAMEEEIFPHTISLEEGSLDEERRLCYVGLTRAKKNLYLTFCRQRMMFGSLREKNKSRFLSEIPDHLVTFSLRETRISSTEKTHHFQVGERVVHRSFGKGIIEEMKEAAIGPILRVYFFERQKVKHIALQYSSLERDSF